MDSNYTNTKNCKPPRRIEASVVFAMIELLVSLIIVTAAATCAVISAANATG